MFSGQYDILIIGAGPAGLMGAIAVQGKKSVCILEKNDSPGKKLLISGTGRCNITHAGPIESFLLHYGDHSRFVKPALYHFSNSDLANFMSQHQLPLKEVNAGKLFPVTESSRDVLQVFLRECHRLGVQIKYHSAVKRVKKTDDGFLIETETESYRTQKLLLATGGKSFPTTGANGEGYAIASSLGHTITEIAPALTPVIVRHYAFADCAGLSFDSLNIRVYRNGKKFKEGVGDLLFTHHGLSGPGILDMSRWITHGDLLKISLVAASHPTEFENQFLADVMANGKKTIKNILTPRYLPERLGIVLLNQHKISAETTAATLEKSLRKKLVSAVTEAPFTVERLGDFHEAMATRGGVSLTEVNRNTMESRLVPGLFFCGEVLDVDGDTGGYNLQFAFSSGALAGQFCLG